MAGGAVSAEEAAALQSELSCALNGGGSLSKALGDARSRVRAISSCSGYPDAMNDIPQDDSELSALAQQLAAELGLPAGQAACAAADALARVEQLSSSGSSCFIAQSRSAHAAVLAAQSLMLTRRALLRSALLLFGPPPGQQPELDDTANAILLGPPALVPSFCSSFVSIVDASDNDISPGPLLSGEVNVEFDEPLPIWRARREESLMLMQNVLLGVRHRNGVLKDENSDIDSVRSISEAFAAAARHWNPADGEASDANRAQALACAFSALASATHPCYAYESERRIEMPETLKQLESQGTGLRECIRLGMRGRQVPRDASSTAELVWCITSMHGNKGGEDEAKQCIKDSALQFMTALLHCEAVRTFDDVASIAEAIHSLVTALLRSQGGQNAVLQAREYLQQALDLLAAIYNIDATLADANDVLGDLLGYARSKLSVTEPAFGSMVRLLSSLGRSTQWVDHVWDMLSSEGIAGAPGVSPRAANGGMSSVDYDLSWKSLMRALSEALQEHDGEECQNILQLLLPLLGACLSSCDSAVKLDEWLRNLLEKAGGKSLHSLLGSLLGKRVSHQIKASCCECIAHLARARSGDGRRAVEIWDEIKRSGGISLQSHSHTPPFSAGSQSRSAGLLQSTTSPAGSKMTRSRSDIGGIERDIFEVESKAGDFPLAVAFLDAASAVLEAGAAWGEEMPLLNIAKDSFLGRISDSSVSFAANGQTHDIAAGCLRISRLLIQRGGEVGAAALSDVLEEGELMHASLSAIGPGLAALDEQRIQNVSGRSMERAAKEALELLCAATRSDQGHQVANLLLRQRREKPAMELTCYRHSKQVQMAAISLLYQLAENSDRLVTTLMSGDYLQTLRDGVTSALYNALQEASTTLPDQNNSFRRTCEILLQLALHGLGDDRADIPLAFVLAGFRPKEGGLLDPSVFSTTLSPLLEHSGPNAWTQIEQVPSADGALSLTKAAEAGMTLCAELLDFPETGEHMFHLLMFTLPDSRSLGSLQTDGYPGDWLKRSLEEAMRSSFEGVCGAHESSVSAERDRETSSPSMHLWIAASFLGAQSMLLTACARLLHGCVMDVDSQREGCETLVSTLLGSDGGKSALHRVVDIILHTNNFMQSRLECAAEGESANLIEQMPDSRISSTRLKYLSATNASAVYKRGEYADYVIDEQALLRCAAKTMDPHDTRSLLTQAQHHNALAEARGARINLMKAWQGITALLISRHFSAIEKCCGGVEDSLVTVWSFTKRSLDVLQESSSEEGARAAAVAMITAAKAREVASATRPAFVTEIKQSGAIDCIGGLVTALAEQSHLSSSARVYLYTALSAAFGAVGSELVSEDTHQAAVYESRQLADLLARSAFNDVKSSTGCDVKTTAILCLSSAVDALEPESGAVEASLHGENIPDALLTSALRDADAAAVISSDESTGNSCVEAGAQALALLGRLASPRSLSRSPEKLLQCDALSRIAQLPSLAEYTHAQSQVRLQALALQVAFGITSSMPESQEALEQAKTLMSSLRRPLTTVLSTGKGVLLEPAVALAAGLFRKDGALPAPLDETMQTLCADTCQRMEQPREQTTSPVKSGETKALQVQPQDDGQASRLGDEAANEPSGLVLASLASYMRAAVQRSLPPPEVRSLIATLSHALQRMARGSEMAEREWPHLYLACAEIAETLRLHLSNMKERGQHLQLGGMRTRALNALDEFIALSEPEGLSALDGKLGKIGDNGRGVVQQNTHTHFAQNARKLVHELKE
jgi:hypothetical protein